MCYENVGMTDSHREPCFINRREDGKVKQGCGEWNKACPDNKDTEFCKYCRTRNCNDEKIIPKYCWTNYGKIKVNGDVPCFAERTKANQRIGKCPSIACKTCYKNLCNDGNDLPFSFCFDGDGKGVVGCGSKAGCGTCDENKIDNSCVDCRGLNCNIKDKLKENVFCYERKENGNEKEGGRPCKSKFCFISVDVNKGN
ncbi:unnamed protein product [Meloidogyne enterolobii]|uniref:Uncharacterized protein n=1 Tax=Meloidogyne enterolobii TaxID=390850 RepID=A0ACB0ZUG5_MELEN